MKCPDCQSSADLYVLVNAWAHVPCSGDGPTSIEKLSAQPISKLPPDRKAKCDRCDWMGTIEDLFKVKE